MARHPASSSTFPDARTRILGVHGPDLTLQQEAIRQLCLAMEAEHGAIEVLNFDGETCALADVLDELRCYGLMQQYKVVVVDRADTFVSDHRASLQRYAEAPVDHASLVLRCGRWNRGNLDKAIAKVGGLLKCEVLKAAELQKRLTARAAHEHGLKLSPRCARMLVERVGQDLGRLQSELDKLAILVGPDGAIDEDLVTQVVGRTSEEEAWAVQEPLLGLLAGAPRGAEEALLTIRDVVERSRRDMDVPVLYFVADLMRKLHLAAMMRRQGVADGQIASHLKLWGPRQSHIIRALAKLSASQARGLFDRIMRASAASRSGRGSAIRNLECFCVALTDKAR